MLLPLQGDVCLQCLINAGAKDCGAHTHYGRTAGYGNGIVVAHAPAALAEGIVGGEVLRLHLVKQLGALLKLAPYLFFIVGV